MGEDMTCASCGAELEWPGQGHTCRCAAPVPAHPHTSVRFAAWATIVLAVLVGATSLATALALLDQPGRVAAARIAWLAGIGLFVALVVTLSAFLRGARRVLEERGLSALRLRHWAFSAWSILFLLSVAVQVMSPSYDEPGRIIAAGLLAAAVPFLVVAVLATRAKVVRALSGPAFHGEPPAPAPPEIPGPLLPVTPQPGDWDATRWDPEVQADIERRRRRAGPG
jgi:hypothetical protein